MSSILARLVFKQKDEVKEQQPKKEQPKTKSIKLVYRGKISNAQSLCARVVCYDNKMTYTILKLGNDIIVVDYSGNMYALEYTW